ncbi:hypothetical protein [Halobacillus sp. K22]|uniref:hypothetical protein n=1 Tax=Halobacillus sp. K22 TaxID=3457431 RepID=UPI003FCDF9DA
MKKIKENKEVFGLSAKFHEGVDYSDKEGTITQIWLDTRNTRVPMIVTSKDSEAKKEGADAMFALCSEKCGKKMKETLNKEISIIKDYKDIYMA